MATPEISPWALQEISRLIYEPQALAVVEKAEATGRSIRYFGYYRQGFGEISDAEVIMPFVLTLNDEEAEALERDHVLRGVVHELTRDAQIEGTLTDESIQFKKNYMPETNILLGATRIYVPINYTGQSNDDEQYQGTWSFEHSDGVELSSAGDFLMQKVHDVEGLKQTLWRAMTADDN